MFSSLEFQSIRFQTTLSLHVIHSHKVRGKSSSKRTSVRFSLCQIARHIKSKEMTGTLFSSTLGMWEYTGPGNNTCTWFGEVGSCCCLPLLPQLACNVLATTYKTTSIISGPSTTLPDPLRDTSYIVLRIRNE